MSIPLIPINYCTSQISEKLLGLGVSLELSQLVAECLSVRREEARAQLVRDSCNISHCHLSDYDWKLKVTLANLHLISKVYSLISRLCSHENKTRKDHLWLSCWESLEKSSEWLLRDTV